MGESTARTTADRPFQRSRTTARFWSLAGVLFFLFFGAGVPSPLYDVYQAEWHFSAATLTAIFAIYALLVLMTLLCLGSLSDLLGRRAVIALGLFTNTLACALFLLANGVGFLFAGRALQGFAVGVTVGALGASLIDSQPTGSGLGPLVNSAVPNLGLALGSLCSSAFGQYGPDPTRVIWWLTFGASLVSILALLVVAEPPQAQSGVLAWRWPRGSVPLDARRNLLIAAPCFVAVWALGGLYLSLGPSLASQILSSPNRLWGGAVIFLLCGTAAAAAALCRLAPPKAMTVGCLALLSGAAMTFASVVAAAGTALLVGTALAGAGFGLAYLGAFRTSIMPVSPRERAGVLAAIYIISYLAFSIPALAAGLATRRFGLHDTALVYSASVALLVAVTLSGRLFRRGARVPPLGGPW